MIRHGLTEGNRKNMYYGHSDIPLVDEGVSLIKALSDKKIYPRPKEAAYYTSGQIRAEQTFSLIYGEIPHMRLDGLMEINFGEYELKTHSELKKDPAYILWIKDKSGLSAPPGGESVSQFKERVKAAFRTVLETNEKHLVIVCHAGVISVIMEAYFDENGENMFKWTPEPGHGYSIALANGDPSGYTTF
jgi:broad specificity phosphatase PhoE